MKPLEQAIEHLNLIKADLYALDPRAVHAEVLYMRGSRVKAWSANEAPGAGSSEPPMLLPDRLDRWIAQREREFHRQIGAMLTALEAATLAQRQLLARLSQAEAAEIAEAEAAPDVCSNCHEPVDRAKGERLLAGRCFACYEYRRRHDNQDAPESVLAARLEAKIQAAAAARVPGARKAAR